MTTYPASALAALSEWIDNYPPNRERSREAALWGRVAKVGEEAGEIMTAMIGLTDQNPRKGITHDRTQLIGELLDVAITALAAVEHVTGNQGHSWPALMDKLDQVRSRSLQAMVER